MGVRQNSLRRQKGRWPILEAAGLAEKYDMAVVAAEGYATEAASTLFAHADKTQNYQLFVLHDADPHGYNIARTLREATRRMPGYQVDVVDLGLKLEDALAMGLQTEELTRKKALPEGLELTETERCYFEGQSAGKRSWIAKRIELNALTAPALVDYIEHKLQEAGVRGKVIPSESALPGLTEGRYHQPISAWVDDALERLLSLEALKSSLATTVRDRIALAEARQRNYGAFLLNTKLYYLDGKEAESVAIFKKWEEGFRRPFGWSRTDPTALPPPEADALAKGQESDVPPISPIECQRIIFEQFYQPHEQLVIESFAPKVEPNKHPPLLLPRLQFTPEPDAWEQELKAFAPQFFQKNITPWTDIWTLMFAFQHRPWRELFIVEDIQFPRLRYRPTPWLDVNGNWVQDANVETQLVYDTDIIAFSLARTHNALVNYFST
ncbi:MAG TPA: hypothetical protein VGX03_22725 [Candidatus Binatia bacterium]|nr:hypothetical protein [Candidatus Binatia bacterium]